MHDETMDDKPHVQISSSGVQAGSSGVLPVERRQELSIWFFCGVLMLTYGLVLTATGVYEHFGHQPPTVLANLEPTFWWGVVLSIFGGFYAIRFRPGRG